MAEKQENLDKLKLLESLKKASKDLLSKWIPMYTYTNLATIKIFFELTTELDPILSSDPTLFNLSHLVSNLKNQLTDLQNSQDYSSSLIIVSFFRRQIANYEVSRTVASIEAEVEAWVDQDSIKNLAWVLLDSNEDEEEKVKALTRFEKRVSNGFNRELQEMILKAKVFSILEAILEVSSKSSTCSIRVFEQSAMVMVALVKFNKDVFVGQVLMGPNIIRSLVSMASYGSILVLSSLVKLIRSPLVYEMEAHGYIPKITSLLNLSSIGTVALECVCQIASYATKEAVEAMIREGLIEKLAELQRLERIIGGDSIDDDDDDDSSSGGESRGLCGEREAGEEREAFTSCVTRFVVHLEMGAGLGLGEKRELKQEILRRIREASGSEAVSAAIVSEVLWGSSPLLR